MAVIRPFFSIRPSEEKADKIAALPYDVYNREEAKAAVANHPLISTVQRHSLMIQ